MRLPTFKLPTFSSSNICPHDTAAFMFSVSLLHSVHVLVPGSHVPQPLPPPNDRQSPKEIEFEVDITFLTWIPPPPPPPKVCRFPCENVIPIPRALNMMFVGQINLGFKLIKFNLMITYRHRHRHQRLQSQLLANRADSKVGSQHRFHHQLR